jgi:hypothetical protein
LHSGSTLKQASAGHNRRGISYNQKHKADLYQLTQCNFLNHENPPRYRSSWLHRL